MAQSNSETASAKHPTLGELRHQITAINHEILVLLNRRAEIGLKVSEYKERNAIELFIPSREQEMLDGLVEANAGPFPDEVVRELFREIFRASLGLMQARKKETLRLTRRPGSADAVVEVGDVLVGRHPVVIAGPCSVEDPEQMERVAAFLARQGVQLLRGGAFKPRTSPYSFQGLGEPGLRILKDAGARHGLKTVTEVVDTRSVELVARYADVLQVGARNMMNYELLKAVATTGKPVLLKRSFAATLDEWLRAAEYLALGGNERIILCERGIRTFSRETRCTLDISAIPLMKELCRLPIVVDVSHAAGRRDILPALARASLAAGAHGIMVEVHPTPHLARSDSEQQLDLEQFAALMDGLRPEFLGAQSPAAAANLED
ncbi:MAG: bifunctional 3-deoxy-7-phosphoheptulonate synthase/chorismate mutase [Polyangia bacterium]|jgi:3-deoxy-7-phosphoheptulonate synthase/chorismate mutase|nr:bifunctional 3-deoxy-7-phosphoheptulonate synthase/chorismate mutase [Polyangia bacterium]